ncbi:MAG TPA: SET domain-containing protein [Cryomorphaceae bacterium]|nr:SET domain-containing protein [Cryomorphaceae bacterium]
MIHPDTELQFISPEVGHGVVATKFIPAGTITWVLDKLDREFTPNQFDSLEPLYQNILDTYTFRNNKGNLILCWDNGRFVNHSFNSNCLTTPYDFEIAIRDIHPGEQLTDDYGYLNITEPFQGIDEGTERKVVYPDDLLNYHHEWDEKIKKVFNQIVKLEQPLRPMLEAAIGAKVDAICRGEAELESIVLNYFEQK